MASDKRTRREMLLSSLLLSLAAGKAIPASPAVAAVSQKALVAYFSRSGNTRVIAGQISRALQADLFEIQPENPYPADYFETVEQARNESDRGYEPALKAKVANLSQYTTIFLGFPIWGMTAPPVIRSFLTAHDIPGKTILPLITHGGYGLGDSLEVVASHAQQAQLVQGFTMQAPQERQTIDKVTEWLGGLTVGK